MESSQLVASYAARSRWWFVDNEDEANRRKSDKCNAKEAHIGRILNVARACTLRGFLRSVALSNTARGTIIISEDLHSDTREVQLGSSDWVVLPFQSSA